MKTMKRTILFFSLLSMTILLSASECTQIQSQYDSAESAYAISIKKREDARTRYPLVNTAMDKAVSLLAYCHEEISLSEQHLLRNRLRKLDEHRSNLALAAVDEYRRQYGIKPDVTTIYHDRRYGSGPSGSPLPSPSGQPLPPVLHP